MNSFFYDCIVLSVNKLKRKTKSTIAVYAYHFEKCCAYTDIDCLVYINTGRGERGTEHGSRETRGHSKNTQCAPCFKKCARIDIMKMIRLQFLFCQFKIKQRIRLNNKKHCPRTKCSTQIERDCHIFRCTVLFCFILHTSCICRCCCCSQFDSMCMEMHALSCACVLVVVLAH